ncbi:MAG: hypothetical protein JSU94_15525, partial [Phycisphaerales bacterium]
MSWDQMGKFLSDKALWVTITGGLIVLAVAAVVRWVFGGKREAGRSIAVRDVKTGERSASQVVVGDGAKQEIKIDKSRHVDKGVHVTVEPGGTLNIV